MKPEILKRKMRTIKWNANKRTIAKRKAISDDVLDHVDALRESGNLEAALKMLSDQDAEALASDHRAQLTLGLIHYGLNDLDSAMRAFECASERADQIKADVLLNQANLLKVKGDFDAALKRAYEVRRLAPRWFASHLIVIAVHECRGTEEDLEAVGGAVSTMKEMWPNWHRSSELWKYLNEDVDYTRLRQRTEFDELINDAADQKKDRAS